MNRLIFLAALLLAQALVSLQAAPVSGQPTKEVAFGPKWKKIGHDGFSAQIPDTSFETWSANRKDLKFKNYAAETENAWYFAFAYDKLDRSPMDTLLRFAAVKETAVSDVSIDGVSGKRITFSEFAQLYHEVLAFTVQDRAFIFHAVRKSEDRSETDYFFGSIEFDFQKSEIDTTPQSLALLIGSHLGESKSDKTESEKTLEQPASPESPTTHPGSAKGSGSGSGSGSGVGSGPPSKGKTTNDTPLKLLSSARPGYTDLARRYNVKGTVVLRVTFLPDGTIGAVSVARALPMGLTDNAITAAKQIRFEPYKINGRAITVNKPVHYKFTIY